MSHTVKNKAKLLNRVRRISGQVQSIEKALETEAGCSQILQRIAAARGAMNGLMSEVMEEHVRTHVFAGTERSSARSRAAEELIDVVRAYLK